MEKDKLLWKQLLSLSVLYAAVIIGWIAYYNYQPKLLEKYHLNELTVMLFVAQGFIMVITPPIAGFLADKYRVTLGKRLPIITAGISFAAMIFMATAFTLFTDPGPGFVWILPVLIVLWLFSMSLFTSPAISTVELFAPSEKLPTAMVFISIVYDLLYASEPLIVQLIDTLGAPLTFAIGGVAVFGGGLLMRKNTTSLADTTNVPSASVSNKSDFTYALVLGIVFGLVTTLMFNYFPGWFTAKGVSIGSFSGETLITIILVVAALATLPVARWVEKNTLLRSVLFSILALMVLIFLIWVVDQSAIVIVLLVLFAVAYSMASISTLPLALTLINQRNKVLGVGIFFAGFELPNAILEALLVAGM